MNYFCIETDFQPNKKKYTSQKTMKCQKFRRFDIFLKFEANFYIYPTWETFIKVDMYSFLRNLLYFTKKILYYV